MKIDKTKLKRQEEIVESWKNNNYQGTILAVTGFGKTYTKILGIKKYSRDIKPEPSVVVVVPSTYLHQKWEGDLKNEKIPNAKVWTINSIVEESGIECDILILDEIHKYASDVFGRVFDVVNYKAVFGGTATLPDDFDKVKYIKQRCPVIGEVPLHEALENGWVSDYKMYNLGLNMNDEESKEYFRFNSKYNKFFSTFNFNFDTAMKCLTDDDFCKRYARRIGWSYDMVKAHSAQFNNNMQGRKKFLYNCDTKVDVILDLIDKFPDERMIVFSQSTFFADKVTSAINASYGEDYAVSYHSNVPTLVVDAEGNRIAESIKCDLKKAKRMKLPKPGTYYVTDSGNIYNWSDIKDRYKGCKRIGSDRRKDMSLNKFIKGESKVLNAAKSLDLGLDIPDIRFAIVASGTSTVLQELQRLGRIIRFVEGKQAACVQLYMKDTQDEKWLKKRQEKTPNIVHIDSVNEIKLSA